MRMDAIIREIGRKRGVPMRWMVEPYPREDWAAPARQEAMYELRKAGRWSSMQIAKALGLADHTSVIKGADVHADRRGLPRIRRVAAVLSVEGNMDGLRHGVVSLGGVKRFYQFDRLTGHVTLYSEPANARGIVIDENPKRLKAAREVLLETIGLAVAA